jgi:hypothetical protein
MKCAYGIATFYLLVPAVATAQQNLGIPPAFKVVASTNKEKGQILLMETVTRMIAVNVEREVDVNGVKMRVTATEYSPVIEQRIVVHDATKSRLITPDGKQLPIDEVWKRLKANTVVVVSSDGKTPSDAFLRALGAETPVLILPPPTPMPLPAPEPKKT